MITIENIQGIENASIEEIKKVGNEAFKAWVKLFNSPVNSRDDFDSNVNWYRKIAWECIYELKKKGVYTEEQAGKVYKKFVQTKLIRQS